MQTITHDRFGKDHWSVLAYIETLCVDASGNAGEIDPRRLRCNPEFNPMKAHDGGFSEKYSTRLRGYFDIADPLDTASATAAGVQAAGHDDWHCIEDLEGAGLVEMLSYANGFIRLTDLGIEVANDLRAHKARGGVFANFTCDRLANTAEPEI